MQAGVLWFNWTFVRTTPIAGVKHRHFIKASLERSQSFCFNLEYLKCGLMQDVYDVLPNYLLILGFPWRTDIKQDIISVNLSFSNVRMSSGSKLFSHDFDAANFLHCLP